jgi:hypothetical protein
MSMRLRRVASDPKRRPAGVMRLQVLPVVVALPGHLQQSFGEWTSRRMAAGAGSILPEAIGRLKKLAHIAAALGQLSGAAVGIAH